MSKLFVVKLLLFFLFFSLLTSCLLEPEFQASESSSNENAETTTISKKDTKGLIKNEKFIVDSLSFDSLTEGYLRIKKFTYSMDKDYIRTPSQIMPLVSSSLFALYSGQELSINDSIYVFGYYKFPEGLGFTLYNRNYEGDVQVDFYSYFFIDNIGNVSDEIVIATKDTSTFYYEVSSVFSGLMLIVREFKDNEWSLENEDVNDAPLIEKYVLSSNSITLDTLRHTTDYEEY